MRYEKLVTHVQPHASAMSLLESGIALYKSDHHQQQQQQRQIELERQPQLQLADLTKVKTSLGHAHEV